MALERLESLIALLQPLTYSSPFASALFIAASIIAAFVALGISTNWLFRLLHFTTGIDMQGLGLLALERSRRWASTSSGSGGLSSSAAGNGFLNEIDEATFDRNIHTLPGLVNTSTTCYLNSTCQSLASLPSFLSYLQTLLDSSPVNLPVTESLCQLLRSLNMPTKRSIVLRTDSLVQNLMRTTSNTAASRNRRRVMQGSGQQDAQEFFLILTEAVEEEKKLVFDKLASQKNDKAGFQELLMPMDLLQAITRIASDESLDNPFQATMAHRTSCITCGYCENFIGCNSNDSHLRPSSSVTAEAIRHQPAEHLTLNVPSARSCQLHSILADYTKLELIEEYTCPRCSILATHDRLSTSLKVEKVDGALSTVSASKKKRMRETQRTVAKLEAVIESEDFEQDLKDVISIKLDRAIAPATKQVMYCNPPKCLVVHLSRSSFYEGAYGASLKNNCQVIFPEFLNMDPYTTSTNLSMAPNQPISQQTNLVDPTLSTADNIYRISSVIVHFGSHSYGHYVSFRRRLGADKGSAMADATSTNDWYRISDETVELSTVDEMLRANPFLLFYERCERHDTLVTGCSSTLPTS